MNKHFRRIISVFITLAILTFSASMASASSELKQSTKPFVYIAPATESTINGIPESQFVQPNLVIGDPIFVDYIPNTYAHNDFWKLIARTSFDNRYGTGPVPLTLNITSSTSQGSEWSGSITLNAEFKVAFLAKLGATIGGGYKETRVTNEAVGASSTITVLKGENKGLEAYWGGENTTGTAIYKRVDTGSSTGYTPNMSTTIGAFVHTNYFDVHFRTYNP